MLKLDWLDRVLPVAVSGSSSVPSLHRCVMTQVEQLALTQACRARLRCKYRSRAAETVSSVLRLSSAPTDDAATPPPASTSDDVSLPLPQEIGKNEIQKYRGSI